MVEDRQGNGKLLHDGENGLIAIYFYFFKVEQVKKHEFKKKLTSKLYLVETILEST